MSDLVLPIKPSGRSNTGELTKWLKTNLESSLKIERFNQNLVIFKKDWCKTASELYTKRSQKDFEKYVTVSSLTKGTAKGILEGGSNRTLANITLKVESNKLSSFNYDTHLGMVSEDGGSGKHRVTRVAILKGSRKKVPIIPDTNKSSFFKGAMGAKVTPRYKGRIKGFVPKGHKKIYIRLQPKTWGEGHRRLPIAEMYGIPNAYLLNSNRTKTKFNFDQRLKDLWKP